MPDPSQENGSTRCFEPVTVRQIDWAQVLADIRGSGIVLRQITRVTGISKPTLLQLRGDHDLKMSAGEHLLALWMQVMARAYADVPRRGEPVSGLKPSYVESWARGTIHCPLCGTHHPCRDKKR